MKPLATLILLVLICFLHHNSAGPISPGLVGMTCCLNHTQMKIPKAKVKHVVMTPSGCKTDAIVVTSVCDQEYCIDPKLQYAKKLLEDFKKLTANVTSPPAPFNQAKCEKRKKQ